MKNAITFVAILAAMVMFLQPGHWAMIAALLLMIVVHEFGHWFLARIFGFKTPVFSVGFGSSPRLYLGKFWDTEFQITPWLAGGYVKIDPTDADFTSKAAWKRALVLVGGVTMNVLTVIVLSFLLFTTVGERSYVPAAVQVQATDNTITIARDAGIVAGDRIISVDGKAVHSAKDLAADLKAHTDGSVAHVIVNRGGTDVAVDVTPNADGRVGVALAEQYTTSYHKYGIVDGASRSVAFTWEAGTGMVKGLGMMLHIVPLPQGAPEGAADVHGIVAIVQMGAMAFNDGLYSFVMLVCMISMNLAFFNILPIPMLDGGHLLFLGIEKLRGKPMNPEIQGRLSMMFLFLLLALFAFGLFNDVFNPVRFK